MWVNMADKSVEEACGLFQSGLHSLKCTNAINKHHSKSYNVYVRDRDTPQYRMPKLYKRLWWHSISQMTYVTLPGLPQNAEKRCAYVRACTCQGSYNSEALLGSSHSIRTAQLRTAKGRFMWIDVITDDIRYTRIKVWHQSSCLDAPHQRMRQETSSYIAQRDGRSMIYPWLECRVKELVWPPLW